MTSSVALVLEVKQKTQGIEQGVRKVRAAHNQMQKSAKETASAMDHLGRSFKRAFIGLATIGTVVAALRSVNTTLIKFSASVADLGAITGATGKDLKFIKDAAIEFGASTSFAASEVAEAFKLVGGAKGELLENLPALKSVTKEVLTLATAAQTDLPTAVRVAAGALNQFGLEADQANRVVNVLAAGSRVGGAELDDLAESLKYSGTVASQTGLSLEQTVAALEALAIDSIKGSEAGTGLRATLLRLSTQSNRDFNPAIVGLNKALENLDKAGLSAEQRLKLFGLVNITSANSLIKNREALKRWTDEVTGSKDAYEQAGKQADSYASKVKRLGNAFENLKIAIGESATFSGALDTLTGAVNNLASAIRERGLLTGLVFGRGGQEQQDIDVLQGKAKPTALTATRAKFGLFAGGATPFTDAVNNIGPSFIASIDKLPRILKSELPKISDELTKSFIAPLDSAGTQVRVFRDTIQQANERLENAFQQAIGSPAGSAAKDFIGGIANEIQEPFKVAAMELYNTGFKDQIKQAVELVQDIKGARGERRERLMTQLNRLNDQIDNQAYRQNAGLGSSRSFASGGTFSVVGSGFTDKQQAIQKEVANELNKYITQQLEKPQRVELSITVDSKEQFWDVLAKTTQQEVKTTLRKSAKSIAN